MDEDRRVCRFCKKTFYLNKNQKKQVKSKWPINCSRSCARKAQHKRNHKSIRFSKKCGFCNRTFPLTRWQSDRKFCSQDCFVKSRFGDLGERKEKMRKKINAIVRDEKFYLFLKNKAKKIGLRYGVDPEDILQDYFKEILEGRNALIEQTSMETIRRQYNRGVTGKRKAKEVMVSEMPDLNLLKEQRYRSDLEKVEFINDLKAVLSEYEYKIAELVLFGFGRNEIKAKVKKSSALFSRSYNFLVGADL